MKLWAYSTTFDEKRSSIPICFSLNFFAGMSKFTSEKKI
jgi:hypothetical protein